MRESPVQSLEYWPDERDTDTRLDPSGRIVDYLNPRSHAGIRQRNAFGSPSPVNSIQTMVILRPSSLRRSHFLGI